MARNLRIAVVEAKSTSLWDFGNQVLYDLCRDYPLHDEEPIVIAKVWLIGRAYAAAIERGRKKNGQNDNFYIKTVAPTICRSDIDKWINSVETHAVVNNESLEEILAVHARLTRLFNRISGLEKRSLASKYLHFHLPNLFYIYDSRAVQAMRLFSQEVGRAGSRAGTADNEYRKFAEKCLRLQTYIHGKFKVDLTPRQLDKLLLHVHAGKTQQ